MAASKLRSPEKAAQQERRTMRRAERFRTAPMTPLKDYSSG
jgi:hypothetical protein